MGGTIKICGITTAEMLDAALKAGADWVGVVLGPSPRQVAWTIARDWAVRHPGRVVAVLRQAPDIVWEHLAEAPWGGIQVYDAPMADWVGWALRQGWMAVQPVAPGGVGDPRADVWLLETAHPGSGQRLNWDQVDRPRHRFWLAGGLSPDNVAEAIFRLRPDGVDVSSGVEVPAAVGVKDPRRVEEFVRRAREAMASVWQ
jgi:phosphoribosylanthranilate isomerase